MLIKKNKKNSMRPVAFLYLQISTKKLIDDNFRCLQAASITYVEEDILSLIASVKAICISTASGENGKLLGFR